MSSVPVFLSGEGPNELGSRAGELAYQSDDYPGVVQALLSKVQEQGWHVAGAVNWSKIRKYRSNLPNSNAEERTVLGLVDMAFRAEASLVVFVRDADGDSERPEIIQAAIEKAGKDFPEISIVGGVAVEVLESWILAMQGEHGTEKLSVTAAQNRLASKGVSRKSTEAMVAIVERLQTDRLPKDASSLRAWLAKAKRELLPLIASQSRPT